MTAGAVDRGPAVSRRAASDSLRISALDRPLTSYYLILGCTGILLAIGLVMVLSASSVSAYKVSGSSFSVFKQQALWTAMGLPLFWMASRMPIRLFRLGSTLALLASFALLLLVPFLGRGSHGAVRWIPVGPIHIQPSEVTKLALVIWGADLLVRKAKLLGDWVHLMVPLLPVVVAIATLVILEKDMGTTLVVLAIAFALLWCVGAPGRVLWLIGGLGVLGAVGLAMAEPYRWVRVIAFLQPSGNTTAHYQALQGKYALASGGWFGAGLGAGSQKWGYVPESYTDFIFSIIGEELGLVGALGVVLLFGMLAYAGLRVARRSADPFARLAAGGVVAWVLTQALVNMGAVTGLLPITGIPLPLISFGGSALLPTLVALGMLASFARREPGAAEALAARLPLGQRFSRRRPAPARPTAAAASAVSRASAGR
ncbi:MAG: cell division protein FtsW [Frankiales bacterium]|nr:cell division protein FtsW [Frankiales bacterium]